MTIQMQVVLADYAVTHDGKVMMAGAGWSQVGAGPFASALAFIVKVPWDMANQQIAIHAELVDEDGRPVLVNQAPLALDIGFSVGRPDGLRPGSDIDQNLAVQIPPIALVPGRSYEWRISVDSEHRHDWNRGFYVRAPNPNSSGN
ncbi:MAG: hypothetical protein WCK23_07105 [Actinomycetes bacterium]